MRSLVARSCAVALLGLTFLPAVGPPRTAAATSTTKQLDCYRLLAGSPSTLVYADSSDCNDPVLVARDVSGATKTLGSINLDDYTEWSLSGNLLTALDTGGSVGPVVTWWNIVTGESGTLTLPGASSMQQYRVSPSYVSAEPDGVLFLTGHGVLKLESVAGVVTRWTKVFHSQDATYTYASDDGVLLSRRGRLVYVRFDHPATVHVLKDGGSSATKCLGMSSVYAACVLRNVQRPQRYKVLALIALDGSALIETRDGKHHGTGPVMMAGRKTVFWVRLQGPGTAHPILTSRRGDAKQRVQGTLEVDFSNMVSAYRKGIVVPPGGHKIIAATTARKLTTIVPAG